MGDNILIGLILILLTSFVHLGLTLLILSLNRPGQRSGFQKVILLEVVVLLNVLAFLVEASLWAVSYVRLGALASFEDALYYSMITFTTVGYGDITLPLPFHVLGGIEASAGVIMVGWSAALVVTVIQKLYGKE